MALLAELEFATRPFPFPSMCSLAHAHNYRGKDRQRSLFCDCILAGTVRFRDLFMA